MIRKKLKQSVAMLSALTMLFEMPFSGVMTTAVAAEQESVSMNAVVSENEILSEALLNFLYIEKEQISSNERQSIVASLETFGAELTAGQLCLTKKETGETVLAQSSQIQDNVIQFEMDADLSKGVYQVSQLGYSFGDQMQWINIASIPGMEDTCFGVDMAMAQTEDYITIEQLAGLDSELAAEGAGGDGAEALALSQVQANVIDLREEKDGAADKVAEAINVAKGQADVKKAGADEIATERVTAGSLVVVLDPGHDDTHAGATRYGLKEENLTLKIAQYCKQYLEANYTNVVVHMTRSTGACPHPGTTSTVDNSLRVADAKSVGADIYVSFHIDATGTSSTTASGSTVYYPNANYNSGIGMSGASMATMISQQLAKLGINSNGIRIRNSENNTLYPDGSLADYLGVIRLSKENGITAVLIEHAYINNPNDAAYLSNEDNLKSMGQADAIGIGKAYSLSNEEVEYDADDLTITDIDGSNGSFKITLTGATPVDRIKDIKFKVYPSDDSSKNYLYVATPDKKTKGKYTVTGNVTNHGNKTGKYKVIAYAYDAAGRKAQLRSTTFTMVESELVTDGMKLTTKLDSKQTTATITLAGNEGAASVSFRVYSNENGKDDVKTYKATKLDNGKWQAKVKIEDHKSAGDYTVVAYSKSYFGTTTNVKTGTFTVDGPSLHAIRVKNINLNKGTFQLRTDSLSAPSGIVEAEMVVRNLSGKKKRVTYKAKKNSSGEYTVKVDMKDHDYQMGQYRILVYATDKTGIKKQVVNRVYDFGAPTNKISGKLKAKQTKLYMTASGLGINTAIEAVKFRVYNATTKSKKKSYEAKKNSSGIWNATAMVSDFGEAGSYKVSTYIKKKGSSSYQLTGKVQSVSVNDIDGGRFTTKVKGKKTYMYVSGIESEASVKSVQIKAWPEAKTSAKYVYEAKEQDDGKFKVALNTARHANKTGNYRYQVTVTLKNGVTKVLLKGRFESDKSTGDMDENGYYTITGASDVTVDQMMAYYKKYATYPSFYAFTDAPTLKKFCQIYYNECQAEGIKAEVAFAQAMKETNFLRYTGDVGIGQFNFAGIGATGGGAKGNSFASVTIGIRAQVQHLKAYANDEPLKKGCVDPRFIYVARETAPYVEWLGIPDNPYGKGWATAQNYGSSILNMIKIMKSL